MQNFETTFTYALIKGRGLRGFSSSFAIYPRKTAFWAKASHSMCVATIAVQKF